MGITNFPNGISSFGVPIMGGGGVPATAGNFLFVDYTRGDDGRSVKNNSASRPFKTIAKAYSYVTDNNDDVIVLMGNADHVLTAMLTVAKNRVHFVGLDATARQYGQNAKISMGVTTDALNIGTILNLGTRNTFHNIKFTNNDTLGTDLYTVVEGGEYAVYSNCEFYKSTLLSTAGASEFVSNGDSTQLVNCTFGSLANLQIGDIIRSSVRVTKGIATGATYGAVSRDVTFKNCYFWKSAGGTTGSHVYGSGATDVERMMTFDDCTFVNNKLATAVPAQCVQFGASLTVGQVLLKNCISINNTKLSTTTGVFVTGAVPTAATSGIAVQGA